MAPENKLNPLREYNSKMKQNPRVLNSALIICTINRPDLLINLLRSLQSQTCLPKQIIVVDAGNSFIVAQEIKALSKAFVSELIYLKSPSGLPLQRNYGLDHLNKLGLSESLEVVHFLDDDILPSPNYFESVFEGFAAYPEASCIGGFDSNLKPYPRSWPRNLFIVGSDSNRGRLLKSGIAVPLLPKKDFEEAEWVPGHTQNFRASLIFSHRFDPSIRLYGEDIECQLRISADGPIYYSASLGVKHLVSEVGRDKYKEVQFSSDKFRRELVKRFPKRFNLFAVVWATVGLALGEIVTFATGKNKNGLNGFLGHIKFLFYTD